MTIVLFVAGLAFLVAGADLLVRGASRLAAAMGIPALIVGLTVVAFGTSAPEFAVSVKAALAGNSSIGVGNVVGSNIFNVLFILGLAALIRPLLVANQLVRFDVPLMIAASVGALLLARDGMLSRGDGAVLFGGLLAYLATLIHFGRKSGEGEGRETEEARSADGKGARWGANTALVVGGLILLVIGSRWLVSGAVSVAHGLGVSELIIGLTIVAAGTSLPEVVTSIVASVRGERDIAVGNVVGSNLFNVMGVLGLAAMVAPAGIEVAPSVVSFDFPIMIAVAFACLPIFFTGGIVSRWEGGLLFAYYIAYTGYLILTVSRPDVSPAFGASMKFFVLPLTFLTLIVIAANAIRRSRESGPTEERP